MAKHPPSPDSPAPPSPGDWWRVLAPIATREGPLAPGRILRFVRMTYSFYDGTITYFVADPEAYDRAVAPAEVSTRDLICIDIPVDAGEAELWTLVQRLTP